MHTYPVTIKAPVKINPASPSQLQAMIANPNNKMFVEKVQRKEFDKHLDAVCGVLPKKKPVIGYNEAIKDAKTTSNNLLDDNK